MDSVSYLTDKINDIEHSIVKCHESIDMADDEIRKGWMLIKLQDTHPLILAQYNFKKSRYQQIR